MNRINISQLLFLIIITLVFSQCLSPENPKGRNSAGEENISETKKTRPQAENPVADIIVSEPESLKVENRDEARKTAALQHIYIPPEVNTGENVPVVFFFDPHARGHLPVELYHNLADEFGLVMIGSNKSKNNQPIEAGLKYFLAMKNEISEKVTIDPRRIYVMGFSGGARVAVSIAIQEPEINAVVGCGAGFPAIQQLPEPNFYYFGMVGYEDFNMGELINNDRLLTRSGFQNQLTIFDGGHDWPPVEVMREAFLAIQINNIRNQITAQNPDFINKAKTFYTSLINYYAEENKYFDAAETAERAVSVLKNVCETSEFDAQISIFRKNPAYSKDLSAMVKSMETETGKQNNYLTAFEQQDMDWWKSEITALQTPDGDIFRQRLNKRLTAFLGLMSYMMSTQAIKEGDLNQAQKNIDIYRMLEPANPEHAYLNAIVMMKNGDAESAMGYLEQAAILGFNNTERFLGEPAFTNLETKNQFLEMIK